MDNAGSDFVKIYQKTIANASQWGRVDFLCFSNARFVKITYFMPGDIFCGSLTISSCWIFWATLFCEKKLDIASNRSSLRAEDDYRQMPASFDLLA